MIKRKVSCLDAFLIPEIVFPFFIQLRFHQIGKKRWQEPFKSFDKVEGATD